MGEVVELRPDIDILAVCPECSSQCWEIMFSRPDPKAIAWFRCSNEECNYRLSVKDFKELEVENVAAEED